MKPSMSRRLIAAACTLMLGLSVALGTAQAASDDFATQMNAAMARMEQAMMMPASGDPDRDFATMMIPHHQGAVDMAEAELRFGHDPVLRRLAQGIIVEQRQEIDVMQRAISALPAAPRASTTQLSPMSSHATMHMEKMK